MLGLAVSAEDKKQKESGKDTCGAIFKPELINDVARPGQAQQQ